MASTILFTRQSLVCVRNVVHSVCVCVAGYSVCVCVLLLLGTLCVCVCCWVLCVCVIRIVRLVLAYFTDQGVVAGWPDDTRHLPD